MDIKPGSLKQDKFDLYIELTNIRSKTVIQGLKMSLVLGLTDDDVIENIEGLTSSNYHRGKRAFYKAYEIVRKINE
ncbi:hypothetical protein J8M00_21000 [Pseudoalteromonas luteoviolacea]|nr:MULTISPECIES: hypothetical protein [Pseudoalteromonas]MBQ4838828.1 hypothetical protein [Pseudoalteromonas luteoviolacea]